MTLYRTIMGIIAIISILFILVGMIENRRKMVEYGFVVFLFSAFTILGSLFISISLLT